MNFKITDEEYAVLCEIRKNKRTSPERLCMMFYDAAEPALINLEKYFLISHETSAGRRYYYATNAGKNYVHDKSSTINNTKEHKKNNHQKSNKYIRNKRKNKSFLSSNLFWSIVAVFVAIIIGFTQIILQIILR